LWNFLARLNYRWYSDREAIGRNIAQYDCIRADSAVMTDCNPTQNHSTTSNIDTIFDDWKLKIVLGPYNAHRSVLTYLHIVANGSSAQNDSAVMPNMHTTTKLHVVWKGDPASTLHALEQKLVDKAEWKSQQFRTYTHSPIAETVKRNCPKSLLEQIPVMSKEIFCK